MNETLGEKSPLRIELSDNLREVLADVLNEVHNREYSQRFWALILEDYITSVLTLKEALENDKGISKYDKYPINSHTFLSFKDSLKEDLKILIKYWIDRSNHAELREILKGSDQVNLGFPAVDLPGNELGAELPKLIYYVTGLKGRNKRRKVTMLSKKYSDPFLKNAVYRIPKLYVEFLDTVLHSVPLFRPSYKTFHVHNIRSLYDRFLMAQYVEKGAKLIWYQHGSHYGEYNHEYLHHLEHSLADEFRTWGWQIKEKDLPWKAYRLEKFRQEYDSYTNEVQNDLLIIYPKMYQKYRDHCIDVTGYLLKNLNFDTFTKLIARPRPLHKKHGHQSELDFIDNGNVEVSTGLTPVAKEVSESRLVLQMNVPGTNFLECIYVDHPVTGILTNSDPTDLIKPYYTYFLEKGVLHKTSESLVHFLNTTDLDSWWSELQQERVYQQFKKTFTSNSETETKLTKSANG